MDPANRKSVRGKSEPAEVAAEADAETKLGGGCMFLFRAPTQANVYRRCSAERNSQLVGNANAVVAAEAQTVVHHDISTQYTTNAEVGRTSA